jgi:hypothetical protein
LRGQHFSVNCGIAIAIRVRCAGIGLRAPLHPARGVCLDRPVPSPKVSCENCFFRRNLLCVLDASQPCATFRPDGPDGLCPPRQMRFVFRQERRTQAVWAFPSAEEQAALHA